MAVILSRPQCDNRVCVMTSCYEIRRGPVGYPHKVFRNLGLSLLVA